MENIRNQRDIKLRKAETTRNYLFSERNYHATKFFFRKFISNRNEKNTDTLKSKCLFSTINTGKK